KYRPDYPNKPFGSLEEAQAWTQKFVRWYNHDHKHSGLKFVTPKVDPSVKTLSRLV
ncbi:hypothetical protein DNF23_58550, partial [Pseudomonas syringae pv. pisi]